VRVLLAVYTVLIVYASLHPLAGWRDPGGSPLAFLGAPWPRYVTAFDLAANFLGYLPFGLLCTLSLGAHRSALRTVIVVALLGGALSLSLETIQFYLPARIASNVDLIVNIAGAAGGAVLGAWFGPALHSGGYVQRLRAQAFVPGLAADLGLVLLALWLFAQLHPATLLFGTGDLRDLFEARVGERHAAQLFVSAEAATTAVNLAALALLASAGMRPGAPALPLLAALLVLALLVKTLAFSILMRAEHVFAWLTPGAQLGLGCGLALALATIWLPRTARLALGAVLLMVATVLVNLAPPNPYLAATLKVWEQGHFLNFNGLTRLVSAAWPFAALAYLVWIAAGRLKEPVR